MPPLSLCRKSGTPAETPGVEENYHARSRRLMLLLCGDAAVLDSKIVALPWDEIRQSSASTGSLSHPGLSSRTNALGPAPSRVARRTARVELNPAVPPGAGLSKTTSSLRNAPDWMTFKPSRPGSRQSSRCYSASQIGGYGRGYSALRAVAVRRSMGAMSLRCARTPWSRLTGSLGRGRS